MSKSILLADDSATIRRVVELSFSDSDFHVVSVGDGDEALALLETLQPDVVLADVVMPGPTGYEICRQIKSSDRPVPVLLLAGTFETFDHDLARTSGADGCLMKPFESRTLVDRVTSLLAAREAVTSSGVEPVTEEVCEVAAESDEAAAAGAPAAIDAEPAAELPEGFTAEMLETIARAVVRHMSEDVVRQIADEVVPRVAEEIVRRRIREIEAEDS